MAIGLARAADKLDPVNRTLSPKQGAHKLAPDTDQYSAFADEVN